MLSGGSLGHPRILPWCPIRHRPPCCPEDPLEILGSSLGVPSDTGPHAVRRILWTSWDPPLVSPQTKAPMLSGGSLGHTPCCPEDSLDIPGSFLGVPSDTGPHAVRRILWTSRDPPLVSPQTKAPMLSGGSLGHTPCCPEDSLDIPGSFLGVPSDTGLHAVRRILPWCPVIHRPPSCPEDLLDIPGSSLGVPSDTDSQTCQPLQFKILETR